MPALAIVEQGTLAALDAHLPGVALYGAALVAADDDALVLRVEAHDIHHHPLALSELAQLITLGVEEVEVVVAVLLALQDKLAVVPREEQDGALRLHVLLVGLAVELADAFACGCVVAHEAAIVLVAVELKHIDGLRVGAPRYVGEVAVLGIASLEVECLAGCHVVYAHGHLMRCLAGHGILVGLVGGDTGEEVHLRIVGHHALVHAVEGEAHAIGAPEESAMDAKLIAVYAAAIHNLARSVGGELYVLAAIGRAEVELVAIDIGGMARDGVEVACLQLIGTALAPHLLLLLEVDEATLAAKLQQHQRLVAVGEGGVVERTQAIIWRTSQPLVHVVNGEEHCLLARFLIHEVALLHIEAHQLVAPPCEPAVAGNHVAVVGTAKVEVLQCKLFHLCSLLCHSVRCAQRQHSRQGTNDVSAFHYNCFFISHKFPRIIGLHQINGRFFATVDSAHCRGRTSLHVRKRTLLCDFAHFPRKSKIVTSL